MNKVNTDNYLLARHSLLFCVKQIISASFVLACYVILNLTKRQSSAFVEQTVAVDGVKRALHCDPPNKAACTTFLMQKKKKQTTWKYWVEMLWAYRPSPFFITLAGHCSL